MTMLIRRAAVGAALAAAALMLTGCFATAAPAPATAEATAHAYTDPPVHDTTTGSTVMAVITDYGNCDDGERYVADMVASWKPQAVATAGDNTQRTKNCTPYTQSVGDYYKASVDAASRRFFPVPGNHDIDNAGAGEDAYLRYFSYLSTPALGGDHPLWYQTTVGHVTLFMIDSELRGSSLTAQRDWLKGALQASRAQHPESWNVVVMHRPVFTSGPHDPNIAMRPDRGWDYKAWGADVVIAGHQHVFEDVVEDGLHYVTAGVGAGDLVRTCPADLVEGSQFCESGVGAIRLYATSSQLTLEYHESPAGADAIAQTIELNRPSH